MELPDRLDPRDRWLALATESFARALTDDERDDLRSLAQSIDPVRAGAMDAALERLRRQLDAPRADALHHEHAVELVNEAEPAGLVPCDLLACWFPGEDPVAPTRPGRPISD